MKTLHTIYNNFAKRNLSYLRLLLVMFLTLTVTTNAWGADYSKNESWSFNTSGNSNWTSVNCGKYCNAWGKNKDASPSVYKTDIQNFIDVDFSKYENVTLTIYVTAGHNSGTNKYTVKLIDEDGNQVDDYAITKENGMGSGSNSTDAQESSVTFNPTQSFSGYRIDFYPKSYITKTRYVLTYDDKSISYSVSWTINPIEGGLLSATSGNTTTVTPNTAYTYGSPAYTVTSGEATVSQSNNTFTATPTENSTIQINMVEKPKYTVTLMDDESTLTQSTAGGSVTLPSRDGCDGYEFVGWTKSWSVAQTTWTTTAPAIIPTGSYTPTANESLYPVYTKTTEGANEETKTITLSPPTTTSGYKEGTQTDSEGNTWSYYAAINNQSGTFYFGLNSNSLNYNIGSPIFDGKVSSVSFKAWNGSSSEARKFLFCSTNTTAQPKTGDLAEVSIPKSQQFTATYTADLSQSSVSQFYIYAPKALGITAISVTYTTSTSGYTTSYISVPDCDPCNALQAPNVTAKNITTNSFTLSWDPVAGATSYNVYNFTTDEEYETTDLTYTFNGLEPDTEYEWEVEAVSATCDGKGTTGTTTTLKTYTITWKNADGTVLEIDENVPHGTTPTYNGATPTRTATAQYTYSFNGWNPEIYAADKDQVYTAQFASTTRQYTVTFDANGHGSAPDEQSVDYGTKATEPTAPTAFGYTFGGWYKEAECTNVWDFATDVVTSDITLYAQWTEKALTRYRTDCDACIPLDGFATINGTYHFFPGETITLTVTPPAYDVPYTYQWQKLVGSNWTDIAGATTTTYTKDETTIADAGHYRCVVSSEGYCDKYAEYNVKCLQLYVYYDNKSDVFNTPLNRGAEENTATISVDLQNANYKYYFKITDGCGNWYGFNGDIHSGWCTDVPMNVNEYCGLQTTKFGTYVFNVNYSDLAHLTVSVIYPAALQEDGKEIYLDNNVLNWTHSNNADGTNKIYYRIGRGDHNNKTAMTLVPGTANLYKVTTSKYNNFEVWHIANNGCHSESNSIFKTKTNDKWAATQATAFETLPVTLDAVTVTPTTLRSVGGDENNNNCEFYNYDITEGMKTWNAEVIEPTNGTITVKYTHHDGAAVNDFTSGTRDLAHTCLLTITATPNVGYSLASLTVNDEPFNSGDVHTLTANAVIKAEFTINTHTVTWKPAGGNWGGNSDDIVEEYAYGEEIKAPEKPAYDCHEFVAWDPVYTVGMTMPDDDLEFTAQWNKLSYTITFKNYDGTVLQTSTVDCGETPTYTGATPTREQTAQYTYTFKGWSPTIAPATQDQVYTAQFNQTTRSYTVIWYDGTGNAHKTQTANYNATVALPTSNPDPCDDEYPYFIGWTADPINGSTTTQPELVEDVKVTGDCDYYAVFAKGEGGSSDYKLVTSAPADWSGTYLIVNTDDKKAWKGSATSDNGAIDVTITDNTITSNATTDNETFTIATMTGGYSIKGTSGKYISGTNGSNTTNYNNAAQLNTISIDNNNNVTITSNTSVLRQNNSTASLFRYYKSSSYSSQHPIQLYKKGSGVNYTSFITTCCTSWTAPTLTYPTELEENGTATPQLGAGTTHGTTVTYASSNPSILSVNSTTGEISAQAPGTATVTATWSGDETYCSVSSTSNVITVKGSFSVIYHANGGQGTMANQKADENNKIAQLNANQFTRTGYAFVGWNTSSYGTGTAYTDQQTNITLAQNLTLYAQWAPVVTLNDAGNEETAHPTAVNGTITLPDGVNACEPYEFVGWTSDAIADWNGKIEEPALVASPYKPTQPTTLYAVYKIQDEGNPNAFKLSFEGSNGNTYYVDEYSNSPLRGYSNITKDDAVTFIKTKMYPNDDTRYYLYMEEKGEYLYYNGYFNTTSSTPSESQGWIIHTVGDKIKLQSTYSYDPKYLYFSDRDNYAINIDVNASGSEFNMLSAVTSTYVASPLCNQEIEIIFETGNGDFVDNAPATNPLTVSRGDVITLPTCEYPGYEFMGWLKDEQQPEPSDIPLTYYTGDYTVSGKSSSITFYAYYKAVPEEVEFTGTDDTELLMYYYDGANYYYASSFDGENGELPSMQNCFNATTWTFTNVGNMQYHIQDETGKYLGTVNDNNNDLSLSHTPKVWNFTLVNGLWKMVCEDSPSRALMYISTRKNFTNAAISNEGNGAYSYITLGICPYPTYTTQPVLSQGFSITNTAMVTSASGQKVKATSALTLETRNIELPCTFTVAAPNITFYDNTGAEVTQLIASAASEQFELHFAYKPTAENTMEYPTITITDDEYKTYTIKNRIYARSLPATFAIVAKMGNIWYALPSQGLNSTDALVGYPVEVDNQNDPTAVTAVPANADWSLRQVYAGQNANATKDRFKQYGANIMFENNASPAKMLNASASDNYLLTNAEYDNYKQSDNQGLYEWTPTTTDLETYTLTNAGRTDKKLNVSVNTVFGVHAQNVATNSLRFLPIDERYTPLALQVVEWKENSIVVMYNGDPAQTASVSVNGGAAQTTTLSAAQRDIAVYELTATGLADNPTQRLSITIGTKKLLLPIPYIVNSNTTDATLTGNNKTLAAVSDLVVLNGKTFTADAATASKYTFRNVTIYGGGKLVIPSEKGFGVASLTLRAGGITDAGEYDYVYPQFELRGTFTNSAAKINYDYITDYDHWYHLVLPFAGDLGTIKYPTEFYGANVAANNTGSWQIKRYAGEIRATGNYNAWVNIETEGETSTIAGQGYIFWGAPKNVTVNGETTRQKWGIQRITMSVKASDAETEKADKILTGLSSHEDVPNNSNKDNDQGWNLIGNPYMVNLKDMATAGLHACKLVEVIDPATGKWNGQWEWNDETDIRYLTIPSDHFDTYTAKTVEQSVPLVPGRAFFVQLEGEANAITFAAANRASLMPALLAENSDKPVDIETGIVLSNETLQDEVNFWIKDGKTNDYEYNADYPKTPNNNHFNIYGVHTNGDLSWVATGPEYAAESMPIGYQVPAAGTYMLSLTETYDSNYLEALYVTDHEMSPEVTTDLMITSYEFSVNQAETNNKRFTVAIKLKNGDNNDVTGLDNLGIGNEHLMKFIYQDKIYILHHGVIYDATGKRVITINK